MHVDRNEISARRCLGRPVAEVVPRWLKSSGVAWFCIRNGALVFAVGSRPSVRFSQRAFARRAKEVRHWTAALAVKHESGGELSW